VLLCHRDILPICLIDPFLEANVIAFIGIECLVALAPVLHPLKPWNHVRTRSTNEGLALLLLREVHCGRYLFFFGGSFQSARNSRKVFITEGIDLCTTMLFSLYGEGTCIGPFIVLKNVFQFLNLLNEFVVLLHDLVVFFGTLS